MAAVAAPAQNTGGSAMPDRETIARVVEHVLAARGIPRGGSHNRESSQVSPASSVTSAATAPTAAPAASTQTLGAAVPAGSAGTAPPTARSSACENPRAAATSAGAGGAGNIGGGQAINVVGFVSENEVRAAISQGEKIYIGPKTIVTPSARDLGEEHEVFVVTDIVPAPSKKPRAVS
jgi:hypothetical protein